jgi:PPK2 family polyphosphate:nucleotide phosphotransferase
MAQEDARRWRVEPGTKVRLDQIDPNTTPGAPGDKAQTLQTFSAYDDQLCELQQRLWAEQQRSLLVVLQAMDAGGKDGTIKHVFRGLNPQGVRVASFKAPAEEELAHDFLWRVHARTPAKGEVGVFNRSHYEDVLIVRVHKLVAKPVWQARYGHINAFESLLGSGGTEVVKIMLHISPDEQARRLQARLKDPTKCWKFRLADLDERKLWDDYMKAYEAAITRTSTATAPWYIVPANHKWYRNWAVSRILIETLERMGPQYPKPTEDLASVVIE